MNQASEVRKDYIEDRYVIIAPTRKQRGDGNAGKISSTHGRGPCPLCPERIDQEEALDIVGMPKRWRFKVVANRYPAVTTDNPAAYGHQEIVIETPSRTKRIADLTVDGLTELLDVYARRTSVLSSDPKVAYIMVFKNDGDIAGASLSHAHSQIFAVTFEPPHLQEKARKVAEYRKAHNACAYCDIIARERAGGRAVFDDGFVIAFTPYASMHNYELWILPLAHKDNITELDAAERRGVAKALKGAFVVLKRLGLPFNFYFHQVIADAEQHFYLKIAPRGSVWAGVELGSGIIINAVPPEEAAKEYKKVFRAIK